MPGACDPIGTYITQKTAGDLVKGETAEEWRKILEKMCDFVEKGGMGAIPRIDHGRIHFFLKFWQGLKDKP